MDRSANERTAAEIEQEALLDKNGQPQPPSANLDASEVNQNTLPSFNLDLPSCYIASGQATPVSPNKDDSMVSLIHLWKQQGQ